MDGNSTVCVQQLSSALVKACLRPWRIAHESQDLILAFFRLKKASSLKPCWKRPKALVEPAGFAWPDEGIRSRVAALIAHLRK